MLFQQGSHYFHEIKFHVLSCIVNVFFLKLSGILKFNKTNNKL